MPRLFLGLLAVLCLGAGPLAAADRKPNVVFILADDLGYTDVACYGSKYYETPNIDRLASQGMKFTAGYTCGPNCQPTRAALMSGQYGPRTGVYTVGATSRFDTSARPLVPVENVVKLAPDTVTVAEALKKQGYHTALFGKWHLGDDPQHHPSQQGFDEAIVSAGKHFDFRTNPRVDVSEGAYLADFLTDKALDFVTRHKSKPFFLCLHHFGVHSPYEAKKELIEKFKKKEGGGGHDNPVYAAMLASVDESVGRVLAKLDELKLSEDTLVIFTADNGGVGGYQEAGVPKAKSTTNNAPLRGGKGMLYEGGIRVAYLFRWKGKVDAQSVCAEPILSVDLFPTLLEVAGGKPEKGQVLDGVSYLGLLTGTKKTLGARPLYWHFPGYLGAGKDGWRTTPVGVIREGDWKLMEFFEDGRLELYNVKDDISEKKDQAKAMPERVKEMHARMATWRKEIKAPMPAKRKP